jgi:hypothetical protein
MASNWEAKGSYVFEGSDCIAICDTDNADTATYERRAKIMAAGPDLSEALVEVMSWIRNWDVPFLEDAEWAETEAKAKAAIAKATTLTIQDQTQR